MAWFGGMRSFHSTCLKSYAHALASLPNVSLDKVKRLIGYCPLLESGSCVLHDRALSAVVALGLFAVETELKSHGDEIVDYLVGLLRAVPKATSKWTQNTQVAAKRDGLIAEQFCFKLCLILSNVSIFCEPGVKKQILEAQLDVLKSLVQEFIGYLTQEDATLYTTTIPALLGMSRALQGCHVSRREAFWNMCAPYHDPWGDGTGKWEELKAQADFSEEQSMALFEVTVDLLSSDYIRTLDRKLEQLDAGSQAVVKGQLHPYIGKFLHNSIICLLRDTLTTFQQEPSEELRMAVYVIADERMKSGVQELGTSMGNIEKAYHVVQVLSVAVDLLVWAVHEDELDNSFQRLSSLLTVHAPKLSVLVTPLRAAILQGIASLAEKSHSLVSLALNCYKEFLTSNFFHSMYCDAISGTGSNNSDLLFALMEEPKSFLQNQHTFLSPLHISRQDTFVKIIQALTKAVCRTLLAGSANDPDCVKGFLEPLANQLYTTDIESVQSCHVAECIVMLLGLVAITTQNQHRVLETVVRSFQQRLFHPSSNLDGYIVIELGKIAARTGDSKSVDELSRLMELSLGETVPVVKERKSISYNHIFQPVVNSLVYVASHLQDKEECQKLMLKSLKLFVQQGIDAKKASDKDVTHKATSSSFSLGLMLPVIATLMKHMEPVVNPTPNLVKLFRDFWLYCIIMGFSNFTIGVFPSAWYDNVREIAYKSPLLLSMGAEQYLDKELELNHPLKIDNIAPGELQDVRQSLIDKLGKSTELDRLVYRLTFVQCMYLISIYRLESLRLEQNTKAIGDIFKYLEDKGMHGELWVAIEMIANKLFAEYLERMEAKPADSSRAHELEELTQLLLFKFNHLRGRIKKVADAYLSQLADKFSHLLWSKKVMHTMLDLLQKLSLTLLTMEPSTNTSVEVKLPYLEHSITIPDDATKREKTVSYFAARCQQIIELAIKWTPVETKTILEDYMCRMESASVGLSHHSAISLAATLISKHFDLNTYSKNIPSGVSGKWPGCVKNTVSQPFSKLYLRSRYMGEMEGMRTALLLPTMEEDQSEAQKKLSSLLVEQLQKALQSGCREKLTSSLYRVTALLILNNKLDRTLLYSLCQLPVKHFTQVSIAIGIDCWQWLIASRPDLEYRLMREFASAWKWTVEERMGIFAPTPPPDAGKRPPPIPVQQHMLLIKFLTDRLDVVKTRDAGQVSLIVELLHLSLPLGVGPTSSHPQLLSHLPEATTARFRLMSLAVSVLQDNLVSNVLERTLLRDRVYNTTLDFFAYDPLWPVEDCATVRETISALIEFWKLVKDLKNSATVGQLPTSALEASSSIRHSNSFWQLAFSTETSAAQGSWMNVLSTTLKKNQPTNFSSNLQIPPVTASKRSSTLAKSKVFLKRKNIILALVKHEIERLSVWQNLSGQADLIVKGEEVVSAWINPTQSDRHWRSTIIMAYHSSPHLVFQLTNRFKNLDVVVKEVSRLVHTNPVPFTTIPDAAQILARKETVLQNAPELYHLLYWRDVAPASALIFFSKPFSHHPITAQFASKAMDSFQPDDILLYIPQLVQTVRYDKLGFSKEYLVTAGKKSQLLAHQFLWNMEANKFIDEEGKQKDPEIGEILEKLSDQIKANLSGAALKFYDREFSFFKKITDISGIIRPFPKQERKAECQKALREVVLEPGVYLPSNPDSILLDIDYKSGIPMQSAAKAPFLATFKVAKCGISQVEDINTKDSSESLAELPEKFKGQDVWQGCIFKVGDDVRQDMLALQIMQLFKDVFQGVGLDLYLVPYRVVATGMGCGVIECVPNSKSRDQLGKATQVSLKAYFNSTYGDEDSVEFQTARANFIKSMASYSLISYILQVKDRHNGNIMIDKDGHIIHIDFGFLFESSPGGNLGFEPDFKLTEEMLEVMGGKKSDSYRWFVDKCVKGYLAIRPYQEQIVSLVTLMLDTGLPCFRGNTVEPLRARFHPQYSEKDAARAMIEVVEAACLNFRTYSYDVLQDLQQKIYYHKKADSN